MAYQQIDLEKQPLVTATPTTPTTPSTSKTSTNDNALATYQILVGDVNSTKNDDSLYHDLLTQETEAKRYSFLSGLLFFACIAAQILLCLSIAVGAQLGLNNMQISVLAAVNTGVAATIAVLKGLGLPEKKAVERHRLLKVMERIRFTTRKLRAGLVVDAEKEAAEVVKMHEDAEDQAQVLLNSGDLATQAMKAMEKK